MLKLVQWTRPLRCASSTSSDDCSESIASGFSQTTCLPAFSAARACVKLELIRRRQMNDVDAIVGEHLLEVVVRLGKRDRPALGARPLG